MVCALTFDDGPDGRWTPQILDLLYDAGAHASFFLLGCKIAGDEALIHRIRDEGHDIGVHGWSHQHLPALTEQQIETDLWLTTVALRDTLGEYPTLWRAPYLDTDCRSLDIAANMGLTHVGCDVIVGDWAEVDAQVIAQNVLSDLKDGDVVLLHDGIPPDGGSGIDSRQPTVDAVALLLDTPGVTWCRVSDL